MKIISAFTSVHKRTAARRFVPQINNLWKSPAEASLRIHWPKWNKDGKWLLYLVGISSSGPQEILCSPLSEVNSLQLTQVMFFLTLSNCPKSTKPDCSMYLKRKYASLLLDSRSQRCPEPNGKSEKKNLLANHLGCQATIKCSWVFLMDVVIFKNTYIDLICL